MNYEKLLGEIQSIYPGAVSVRVDNLGTVWVDCISMYDGRRDIPGGTVKLGSSPVTCALADRARAIAAVREEGKT